MAQTKGLIFRQLFEKTSSTYTYLLADEATKQGILIDPVVETAERDAGAHLPTPNPMHTTGAAGIAATGKASHGSGWSSSENCVATH